MPFRSIGLVLLALTARAASSVELPALTAFAPGEVTVDAGIVRERMDTCASNILRHLKVDESFVRPFVTRPEKTASGRFVGCGMLLDALVKASAHGLGGAEMKKLTAQVLDAIIASQSADGRISIFADPAQIGMWDNHDQAYFLQALCRSWEWTRNVRARDAATRLGDYLIRRNSPVNLGLETGFILLYRATGDVRYRDYVRDRFAIAADMDRYADLLAGEGHVPHGKPLKHVYSWLARALAEAQYRDCTGSDDPALMQDLEEVWNRAFTPATSVTGTMSGPTHEDWATWGEKWTETNEGRGVWGETCVSAYLMRCLQYMFTKRAEPRFGDLYERVMYNAFFAAMSRNGTDYRYFTPFEERGKWYEQETFCCPNNFRREIFEIPDAIFFRTQDGSLAVNLLVPATVRTAAYTATVETRYPEDGKALLKLRAGTVPGVWLRIPSWCDQASIICGSSRYQPKGGSWCRIPVGGQTPPAAGGQTLLTIDFPIRERFVRGQRMQAGKVASMRGPVVYGRTANGEKVRFCDENRESVYFSIENTGSVPMRTGSVPAMEDELLSPERWWPSNCVRVGAVSQTVSKKSGRQWRTWQAEVLPGKGGDAHCVLETSGDGGKTWKTVLMADPDGAGPLRATEPKVEVVTGGLCRWTWTEGGRRMWLCFPADEEYPKVTHDQARVDLLAHGRDSKPTSTSGVFRVATPFCMIRLNEAARLRPAEMQEVFRLNAERPGSADGYWFDAPMWNDLATTRKAFEQMKPLREQCVRLGKTFDVQVFTLGHGSVFTEPDNRPTHVHPFPEDAWQVDADGKRREMLCPRAAATLAYVEDYFALLGEVLKPRAVWLDDDLRLGFGREDGCFCAGCLEAFNAAYGHTFARGELVRLLFPANGAENPAAIAGREGVRRAWLDFISASLAAYGRAARKGLDRTHPDGVLGYQSVSSSTLRATGRDALPLLKALSGDGRIPTAIRIGSGCYNENLEEIAAKTLDIAREVERCRASGLPFAQICNEQENYQREILHKSAEAALVESALALAVGCDSLAEYRWGSRGEPMLDYAEFAAKTAAWRPYLARLAAFSKDTALGGVARFVGRDYDLTGRYSVRDDNDAVLARLGVPVTVREAKPACFYADELTREEGGDAAAAETGRLAKFDFAVLKPRNWSILPNTAERKTLLDALDRATDGTFPVRIDRSHRFYVYPRVRRADGKVVAVTLYNGSAGAAPATKVRVRRPAGAYPVWARPETSDLPLYVESATAEDICFAIPSLPGRQVGTVIFGESCPDTAADVLRVDGERAVLPQYKEGGWWNAGYRLAALKMWEVAACDALITDSVQVVAADGRALRPGIDFKVQPNWSAVGLCGAAVTNANPVTLSYAYRAERLDAWFVNAEGVTDVCRGTPAAFNPKPAAVPAGATRLANCWVRGAGRYDHGRFFRCEGPFVPPPPVVSAAVAFPKTLAKLRAGKRVRILAWGDSVTESGYLPDDERWQSQLAARLRARYPQAEVEMVSQGWGGRCIKDFLGTPADHVHSYTNKVLGSGADLVISEFVNDSWFTAADVSNRYGRVLADFRARGIEWVCLTPHYMMPSWNMLKGCTDSDDDPRAYVKALKDFAVANGVGLADAAARWGHLWREGVPYVTRFVNGVNHPDREGMGYFADAFMDLIDVPTVKSAASASSAIRMR